MSDRLRSTLLGGFIGLLSVGLAIGAGEVAAIFLRPAAAPIIAVGNRLILLTPEPVKRAAIDQFGTSDKTALLTGIYLSIAILAVVVGAVALRRPMLGAVLIGAFGLVGIWSASTAAASHRTDWIASAVAAIVGVSALLQLLKLIAPVGTSDHRFEDGERSGGTPLLADRRRFLGISGVTAAGAVVAALGGRALTQRRFSVSKVRAATILPPVATAPAAAAYDLGVGVPFQTPSKDFYRIDTALAVPQINPNTWKLRIHGLVEREMTLTYADLLARPLIERWVSLCCVSNEVGGDLIGTALFRGVRLADILREAGVAAEADQLVASSSDGMTIGSPTAVILDGRDAMLAVGMNGEVLPTQHGFPVRMVVPGLYGYVSACKWIVDIEATTFARAQPYWVAGGWAAQAPVKLAARIDTPKDGKQLVAGQSIAIAGVAWDQHVGVSKVQVQVDDGPWLEARLAPVPSTDTWRQWSVAWQVTPGSHQLRVRAYDGGGRVQDAVARDPFPSGATGLHTINITAK